MSSVPFTNESIGFPGYDAQYAYSRMGGNTSERAVLIVNGQAYEDWETVSVKQAMLDQPPYTFRFTCSEGMPLTKNYAKLQIKPGMDCVIYLAGYKAYSGLVTTRQVFYDAHRHHIEIQGANYAFERLESSVISKTGEFKKVNYEQLMRAICKPLGVNFVVEAGMLPTFKFERVSIPPGQSGNAVCELYARHIGVALTSNANGDLVALAAPREQAGDLVEGKNILEAREIMMNQKYQNAAGLGHVPANDQKWGPETTSVPFMEDDPTKRFKSQVAKPNTYNVVFNEIPVWSKDLHKSRTDHETVAMDQDNIWVTVKVQGWTKPAGGLWGPSRSKVTVTSPMLILANTPLIIKSITFTQDNQSGTCTTLELLNEAADTQGVGRGAYGGGTADSSGALFNSEGQYQLEGEGGKGSG